MLNNFRNKNIKNDSQILGIGPLFRKRGNSGWGINLDLSPPQDKNSVSIAHAPVLARLRHYNATTIHYTRGKQLTIEMPNLSFWQKVRLNECPSWQNKRSRSGDGEQWCFKITLPNGKHLFLPQFELARVLFFHNQFLTNMSLEHNVLHDSFDLVTQDDGSILINVLPSARYPLKYFTEAGNRRVLSWILLDQQARHSYESIYQQLLSEVRVERNGAYSKWDFSFIPPNLIGTQLIVTGWEDYKTKTFYAWEILSIKDVPVDMPNKVDFYHPEYRRPITGKGNGGNGTKPEGNDQYEEDDEETSDADRASVNLVSPTVEFSFVKAIETNRVTNKTKKASGGSLDENVPGELPKDVSANETDPDGNLPGGYLDNLDNLDEQTDDIHLYLGKFTCFDLMIQQLVRAHGCVLVSKEVRKLPNLARCTKHLLSTDGNPRCLMVAVLQVQGKTTHVLEVDTSDAEKPLSTKILRLRAFDSWVADLIEVEKQLLKGSLRWPTKKLDELCGEGGHDSVPHPKSHHQGKLDPSEIEHWAERFFAWL